MDLLTYIDIVIDIVTGRPENIIIEDDAGM